MAQHPQQREPPQHSEQEQRTTSQQHHNHFHNSSNNNNYSHSQPQKQSNEAFHVPKNTTIPASSNENPTDIQQPAPLHHYQDDNKRNLIKNQLYLIEQLQLENADLRNERDQLQLENEELKFQLQMIR